jgi:hypothetical protein
MGALRDGSRHVNNVLTLLCSEGAAGPVRPHATAAAAAVAGYTADAGISWFRCWFTRQRFRLAASVPHTARGRRWSVGIHRRTAASDQDPGRVTGAEARPRGTGLRQVEEVWGGQSRGAAQADEGSRRSSRGTEAPWRDESGYEARSRSATSSHPARLCGDSQGFQGLRVAG